MNSFEFFTLTELQLRLFEHFSNYSQVICIVDTNTSLYCYPKLNIDVPCIVIPAGEEHKNIHSCITIWEKLTQYNIHRNALILCLGGGMITDIGGFAASCFKRGITHINIPTSLLAMVDASVGGKTGIDFMYLKNQIGLFDTTSKSYICAEFLNTLPIREKRSGYAEIIKHFLIADKVAFFSLNDSLENEHAIDFKIENTIQKAVCIKSKFVAIDPFDKGLRKALNFGHTIGHGIESHFLFSKQPLLHGEAVAIGIIAESYISFTKGKISELDLNHVVRIVRYYFDLQPIPGDKFDSILGFIMQDKKNSDNINCVLLDGIGNVEINCPITREEIFSSLNYYNICCKPNAN